MKVKKPGKPSNLNLNDKANLGLWDKVCVDTAGKFRVASFRKNRYYTVMCQIGEENEVKVFVVDTAYCRRGRVLANMRLRAQRVKSSKSLFAPGLSRHTVGGPLRVGLCRIDGLALNVDAAPQMDELRTKSGRGMFNISAQRCPSLSLPGYWLASVVVFVLHSNDHGMPCLLLMPVSVSL